MPRVLVVDDEAGVRESLRVLLSGECEVETASNGDEALRSLAAAPADLVVLDLVMPGKSGLDVLEELSAAGDAPAVLVLTATKTIDTAVRAMQLGAADYVTKPFEVDALRLKIRHHLEHRALTRRVADLEGELAGRHQLGAMIGRSDAMQRVFRTLERVAGTQANVLLTGESGTGKELAARAIHDLSGRPEGPFIALNCAAIPETLMESELFGHERGSFTDAHERRIGKFEAARGGTLFLDEIGELDPAVQAKLLRALQERTIERVGSHEPIPVDARFVAATNRNLERDVAAGRFREDLYYRIHVVPIALPPLRERREDIPLLCDAFLAKLAAASGDEAAELTRPARTALERHAWPGNVRELQNALERAVALREGTAIRPEDLPETVTQASRTESLRDAVRSGQLGLEDAASNFEIQLIREALDRCEWNQTRAAEHLGVTRRLLKIKIDRYGIKN
ncbi:MAG: sigma-54-dependent transcriptional regulator [Myxococcota bacterium]